MRSFLRVLAALGLLGVGLLPASGAAARSSDDGARSQVDQVRIIEVDGLIDPVLADFLLAELGRAEADGITAVVWQLNSEGVVIDRASMIELADRYTATELVFAVWVGPSGSAALGGAAELAATADLLGVSAGSRIGETGDPVLAVAGYEGFGDASERLQTVAVSAGEAVDLGFAAGPVESVSVLGEFLTQIDGYRIVQCAGSAADPASCDGVDSGGVVAATENRFVALPLTSQLFHTVASPEVAYLLFVGGLALLLFELYTAGVGIAGLIGALCLGLGSYGLGVLPVRPVGLVLLIAAFLAFAIDVQTNVPRLYTAAGMVAFALGTWLIWDGVTMSWVTGVAGVIGAVLFAYTGMPSMVRTRFSSPVIGRRWMIGMLGTASTDLDPEGTVVLRDAPWRAITNRATPIGAGDTIRVIGIESLVLEVEPEEGGAQDYRERARNRT